MKIQAKWFAMLGTAGVGALLLMSLFAGSALAQSRAAPTPMTIPPANPNLRRGLPVITSTVTMTVMQGMPAMDQSMHPGSAMTATMPMTDMQQMPAAMPGTPMSHTMPMSMTMPAASGGMCQDGKCGEMPGMMGPDMMGPDMSGKMQAMMEMMHAMMAGGMMTSTMPMSMTQSGGMMMQPGMMGPDMAGPDMSGKMQGMMGPDMMAKMHAMMAGGMMTSTMPMSMTHSGGMTMQPGMMGPDMVGPDMSGKMQGMMGPDMIAKMCAMMTGGMMTSTMPMSMTQPGDMMMQPGMMGPDMMAKMQDMMEMMHVMMAGGMMTSTMPMSMTQPGGMMMQPGQMRQGMMQQPRMMMQPGMAGPDMMGNMQGRGAGPGRMMQPGMTGPGMRDDSWAMLWMQPGAAQGQRLTGDQAMKVATNALATHNNPDLQVAEMLEFEDAFYVRVAERSTGINAFELLVHPYTGMTRQEAGPSTIWNTKYGGSEGMAAIMRQGWAAPGSGQPTADMPIKLDQALKNAQAYLDAQKNAQAAKYYGYYVVPTLGSDGKVAGLLAVNGYTGRVWDENRFGKLLATAAKK